LAEAANAYRYYTVSVEIDAEPDRSRLSGPIHNLSDQYRGLIARAILLAMFQQIAGINAVLYFVPRILLGGNGTGGSSAIWIAAGVGTINLAATVVALWVLGRANRRTMLIVSTAIVIVLHAALAIGLASAASTILIALCLCLFVASFAMGLGSVTWTVLSELLPSEIRERAMGSAVGALWATNLVVATVFPVLLAALGPALTFACFAGISLVALVFIVRFIPETRVPRSLDSPTFSGARYQPSHSRR
jgi:MFS family permease